MYWPFPTRRYNKMLSLLGVTLNLKVELIFFFSLLSNMYEFYFYNTILSLWVNIYLMLKTLYFLTINKVTVTVKKKKILYRSRIKYSLSHLNNVNTHHCFRRWTADNYPASDSSPGQIGSWFDTLYWSASFRLWTSPLVAVNKR